MTHCTTPAIVLRRRSYGDYDLIITFLTRDFGKQTLIAKSAKKSAKRFAGVLEPFACLQIVYRVGRAKGMPVLEEANLIEPFGEIRSDIVRTAYASYWAELIVLWVEEKEERPGIYDLLAFVLGNLSQEKADPAKLSVLYQMRFIGQEGLGPVLERCTCCQQDVHSMAQQHFCIDLKKGGIVCGQCPAQKQDHLQISKGTLKQLQWLSEGSFTTACRAKFMPAALVEATRFLETFVPFHIGRKPKSLTFLQQVRT